MASFVGAPLFLLLTALFVAALVMTPVLGAVILNNSGSHDNPITTQPDSSVQITNNTTQDPLFISLQLSPLDPNALWVKYSGLGTIGPAVFGDNTQNPPNYQTLSLPMGATIIILLPNFAPFRITPISPGIETGEEAATLVEGGKNVITDLSCASGVNYLLDMELTSGPNGQSTLISFNTSPCGTPGKGCLNPYVNGLFAPGTNADSTNCFRGLCNLIGVSKAWAEAIIHGGCTQVSDTWPVGGIATGCEPTATQPRQFVPYSISTSDTNSSATLLAPYQLKLTYSNL